MPAFNSRDQNAIVNEYQMERFAHANECKGIWLFLVETIAYKFQHLW